MKKLTLLFFAAVLMMTACNKPDPEEEWVEYLQRYKWEWIYSQDIASGAISEPQDINIWEFYGDYCHYYNPDYPEYPPYKMTISYDVEGKRIINKLGDVMYEVEITENRLVLINIYTRVNLKKGKRK